MNRAFSWKDQSTRIFDECLKRFQNDENNIDDKDGYIVDTDESDDDDDDDDLKATDNSVFEMVSKKRNLVLQELSKADSRISRWRELTNIVVSPSLPPRLTKNLNAQAQTTLKTNEKFDNGDILKPQAGDIPKSSGDIQLDSFYKEESSVIFKFQYLIMTERLKVTIVKASNLFHDNDQENEMEARIEVCLMPAKAQRQMTLMRKGTRHPVFDTVKYFHGFSLEDIHRMSLRIQVKGRIGAAGPLRSLGDITVELTDFDVVSETCLREFVNTRITAKSNCHELQRTQLHKM